MPTEMPKATTMELNDGLTVMVVSLMNMGSTLLAAMLTA